MSFQEYRSLSKKILTEVYLQHFLETPNKQVNFGSILTGDIVEKLKVILHLHLRAVSQANRQTSEVKLSGIPSAFEEPVKKRNVKRVVKICTSKV